MQLLLTLASPEAEEEIPERFRDARSRWTGAYSSMLAFCVDTARIGALGAEAPRTWTDLLDPALAGEISAASPRTSGTAYTTMALQVATLALLADARTAFAQQGGNAGAIEGALEAAVDWLSGIVVTVGILGLIVAAIFWNFSGSNERRREKATGWIVGCVLAIAVAFLAPSIVALLQDFTGGGGG